MKVLSLFIFIVAIVFSYAKLRKTTCRPFGEDCDLSHYCCGKYHCRDYRCSLKSTKDNQVAWAPDGPKCDFFHHCKKKFQCQDHRCVYNPEN